MRTVSRSAASRKATAKPAVAIARTSATSSTLWWATRRQPPAPISTLAPGGDALTVAHPPVHRVRDRLRRVVPCGRRACVSSAGCSQRSPAVGQSKRPPTVSTVEVVGDHPRHERSRAAPATGACRRRGTPPSPRSPRPTPAAAPTPCRPIRRAAARRSRPWPRRPLATSAVPSVDSSSTTITSATPGAPTTAASSGPIRAASSRAGTTTRDRPRSPNCAGGKRPGAGGGRRGRWQLTRGGRGDEAGSIVIAIRSATMRALVRTSGRPPPGWLDPPTRYSPRRAPRLAGPQERGPPPVRRRPVDRPGRLPGTGRPCRAA